MWDAIISFISNLFSGGGGGAAAPAVDAFGGGVDPGGLAGAAGTASSFYPATATAAGGGSDLWHAGALGLQGAGLGAQLAQGSPQQQMPMSMLGTSAMQPGVDPGAVRSRLAQSQAQGLSGASPDFLSNQLGLTPEELQQILGGGGGSPTMGGGG